jgi:hypothetical protein
MFAGESFSKLVSFAKIKNKYIYIYIYATMRHKSTVCLSLFIKNLHFLYLNEFDLRISEQELAHQLDFEKTHADSKAQPHTCWDFTHR